ncbi:MAG: 1-deoxy-D-xylulose-5-phosphate synthase [Acidimicrobiales bacterium]
MLIENINGPSDLRRLDYEQLSLLAGEIREFIVQAVSAANSGHLGSNLGVVELTLALHRVFSSPRDYLIWDTGHQAYVHKIVTGRREMFTTLRQAEGLSGYPSQAESVHDWVENSHASTALCYAHGIASAVRRSSNPNRHVVAIVGDGALTGGMAYEGLNNLGHSGSRVIVVLNDNGRSYAPTVSRLSESLSRLRLHPGVSSARHRIESAVRDLPRVGNLAYSSIQGFYSAVREVIEPPAFFETLGVRYVGPLDGHDIAGMEQAFRQAAAFDGPIVVHVLTQKGRGYKPAEDDEERCLHDAGAFDPVIGPTESARALNGYTLAFSEAMLQLGQRRDDIVAITAAMPGPTGLLPFQRRWPERFFDVGIAEQAAVTSAAGMAMGGLRPVVAVYSTFLSRAFDQLNLDVGLHGLPVVFSLDRAGITGDDGPSHHGILDMALCLKIPGMTIFAPSSAQELKVMLASAVELSGPAVVRYPKTPARQVPSEQVGSGLSARLVRRGDGSVCILAVGKLLEAAEEAANLLSGEGVDATLWDVRVVRPLDPAMVADAGGHDFVVTVEDGIRNGGAGHFITDAIADLNASRQSPPVLNLGIPTAYIPHAKADRILSQLGLDGPGIAASIFRAIEHVAPERGGRAGGSTGARQAEGDLGDGGRGEGGRGEGGLGEGGRGERTSDLTAPGGADGVGSGPDLDGPGLAGAALQGTGLDEAELQAATGLDGAPRANLHLVVPAEQHSSSG